MKHSGLVHHNGYQPIFFAFLLHILLLFANKCVPLLPKKKPTKLFNG